jgi:hypothetical protein
MKKYLLLFSLLLAGCAHSKPSYEDRTDSNQEYAKEEAKNQERSLKHSEIRARVNSLGSRIKAIDAQIENQRQVIANWEDQSEVASSEAMIANAKLRIGQLQRERADLANEREKWKEKLED